MLNVVGTNRGAVKKRNGSVSFSAPAAEIRSLFAGPAGGVMIGASSTVLYKLTSGGVASSIKTGLTSPNWDWVHAPAQSSQGPYYGSNGVDAPQFFDGTGAATGNWTSEVGTGLYSVVPRGKFVVYLGNRVFMAGATADPGSGLADPASTVFISDIANPRRWPTTHAIQFDPKDGEAITGLGTIGPYVLVFKPSKVWAIYDTETGANRRIAQNIGAVSHRSIVETPAGTFFLTADQGVARTNGSTVERVSDRILPTLREIIDANASLAAAAFHENHYYLAFSRNGLQNDTLLDLDAQLGSWWLHDLALNDLAVWEPSSDENLYGAVVGASRVDRLMVPGQTQDNGVDFTAYWKGPYHSFSSPYLRKRVRLIHFDGSGVINVSVSKAFQVGEELKGSADFAAVGSDTFGGSGTFGGEGTFGEGVSVGEARILTPGVARAWSVIFGNETSDPFEVDSYTFALTNRRN